MLRKTIVSGKDLRILQIEQNLQDVPSYLIDKLIKEYFWPKSNLSPILQPKRSLWDAFKSQNKLTAALFRRTNEKKNTLYIIDVTV